MTEDNSEFQPIHAEAVRSILDELPVADQDSHVLFSSVAEGYGITTPRSIILGTELRAALGKLSEKELEFIAEHERLHEMARALHLVNHRKIGLYTVVEDLDYNRAIMTIPDDKGLPEWQKRRNQSADAKKALVARMKKGK